MEREFSPSEDPSCEKRIFRGPADVEGTDTLVLTYMEPKYHTLFQAVILVLTIVAVASPSANAAVGSVMPYLMEKAGYGTAALR